ncbi:unnamed protein product [Heligmosomoides polygyrus]|uniref:Uncharacterized protein n=1 Tax=Heligmosomoides polygyrus TaxID=6339 RepID=A0A183G1J3_HELPZ|nr:unnamed protein product [Heligmosomoides polygyrus]
MTVSTRSGARSSSFADAPSPPSVLGAAAPQLDLVTGAPLDPPEETEHCGHLTAPLGNSLSRSDDSTLLQAKDTEALGDVAPRTIAQAGSDARSQTSDLTKRIDEVGHLDQLPVVATFGQDLASGPKISVCWIRR